MSIKLIITLILSFYSSWEDSCLNYSTTFKKIYEDVCHTNSSISLEKGRLVILENTHSDETQNNQVEYFYRRIIPEGDSMQLENFISIFPPASKDTIKAMSKSDFFISSLNKFKFSYDKIPNLLKNAFTGKEKIIGFKSQLGAWYYLVKNQDNGECKLHYFMENIKRSGSITLSQNLETPNFFLYNICGDNNPEIFVFTRNYFMGSNLFDIVIYQIYDGT